jgi:hypothetical protein
MSKWVDEATTQPSPMILSHLHFTVLVPILKLRDQEPTNAQNSVLIF